MGWPLANLQPNAPAIPIDASYWKGAIDDARAMKKTVQGWWDANLKSYAPKASDNPDGYGARVNTNRDFTLVERKKADLFYQSPEVACVPSPLFAGQEELLDAHTTLLNAHLGLHELNAKAMVHRVLFDVLCPAGTGWSVMGYEQAAVPVVEQVAVGTQPMPGAVLGLGGPAPVTEDQTVQVPIYERCFWRWFSPKQALVPRELTSSDWDEAPWLGMEFEIPVKVAARQGWVPADFSGSSPSPELHFDVGFGRGAMDRVVRGTLIYYRSSFYRDDRPHPLHYTRLVFVEGIEDPVEHQDSPFQTLTAQHQLTPDSLIGNPIHPLTIRVLTDSAYVPSDCTISRPLVNELNIFREQMIQNRDANVMRWMYNTDTLPTDALGKIVRSPIGGMIGVPGEAFVGEGAIRELPHGTYPRENFQFNNYLDNDLARTHGLDAEQAGADSTGDTTATEAAIRQSNINARLGLERGVVLDWYLRGVTKYSTLLQRYLSVEEAAKVVGTAAAQQWDQWRHNVPSALAFTALPDSTARQDLAIDRKRAMDEYTYFANDPFINRQELLKRLLPRLRYPASLVVTPQPKGPEPSRPTFAFVGEDLNPLSPQYPIVVAILEQTGIQIDPQAVQQAQAAAQNALLAKQAAEAARTAAGAPPNTQHGGKVGQLESLSKHANALTGAMQGTGLASPTGAGGVQ